MLGLGGYTFRLFYHSSRRRVQGQRVLNSLESRAESFKVSGIKVEQAFLPSLKEVDTPTRTLQPWRKGRLTHPAPVRGCPSATARTVWTAPAASLFLSNRATPRTTWALPPPRLAIPRPPPPRVWKAGGFRK